MSQNIENMEAIALSEKLFTVQEYLEFEEQSDVRHEFHYGRLLPIAGTSDVHNEIVHDIHTLIKNAFRPRGCKVYAENVKLEIIKDGKFCYPDVMLTCDEADKESTFIKRHPSLIVEVLSKSTARYDKTDKFEDFQKVPSIQYYLLVESRWQSAILYSKTDKLDFWTYQIFKNLDDVIELPKLNFQLSLEMIYQNVRVPQFATIPDEE